MSFKSLFLTGVEDEAPKEEKLTPVVLPAASPNGNYFPPQAPNQFPSGSFPVAPATAPSYPSFNSGQTDEHLAKFTEMYQAKLDEQNSPAYDFYKFFKGVISIGIDNQQAYQMALSMATAMDASVTKAKLLTQADAYITELTNTYTQYVSNGNSKRQALLTQKSDENQSLTAELGNLKAQLDIINAQMLEKQTQLNMIESKYQPLVSAVDGKLRANDAAKNDIINKLTKVKNNLSQI